MGNCQIKVNSFECKEFIDLGVLVIFITVEIQILVKKIKFSNFQFVPDPGETLQEQVEKQNQSIS